MTSELIRYLRQRIPPDSLVRKTWRRLRAVWTQSSPPDQIFLRKFAKIIPDACFIQIGSNDGVRLDPLRAQLRRTQWHGVMIEPVPHIFERLCENCREYADRVTFKNVAIASQDGILPFYFLSPAEPEERGTLPEFYDMLGSFNKEVILSHAPYIPRIEDRLVAVDVEALSFDSLCKQLHIHELDLLHIDAEGYDYEILKNIDFNVYQPTVLIYEHHHLSSTDSDRCAQRLQSYGYDIVPYGMDSWCLRTEGLPGKNVRSIERAWCRFQSAVAQ